MNGMLVINKEKGISSFGVVAKVRKIYNTKKVGHSGTLDPEATGVMQVMVGAATKVSKYLVEHDKTYIAKIKFGEKRTTADQEGEIIKTDDSFKVKNSDIEKYKTVLDSFKGKSMQTPPIYSALKVDGKKLYEYAREGKSVDIQAREIEIIDITLLNIYEESNEIEFEVSCSKGTYIRSLCEDIAEKLNTVGYMSSLNRTRINEYLIEDSTKLDELEANKDNLEYLEGKLISIEKIFEKYPRIDLNNRKKELFLNGVKLTHELDDGLYRVYNMDSFIGLGIVKDKLLKRDVVE